MIQILKCTTYNVAEDNMLQTEEKNSLNVFSIVTFKEVIYPKRMGFFMILWFNILKIKAGTSFKLHGISIHCSRS